VNAPWWNFPLQLVGLNVCLTHPMSSSSVNILLHVSHWDDDRYEKGVSRLLLPPTVLTGPQRCSAAGGCTEERAPTATRRASIQGIKHRAVDLISSKGTP
jgi:hypothetical protein